MMARTLNMFRERFLPTALYFVVVLFRSTVTIFSYAMFMSTISYICHICKNSRVKMRHNKSWQLYHFRICYTDLIFVATKEIFCLDLEIYFYLWNKKVYRSVLMNRKWSRWCRSTTYSTSPINAYRDIKF